MRGGLLRGIGSSDGRTEVPQFVDCKWETPESKGCRPSLVSALQELGSTDVWGMGGSRHPAQADRSSPFSSMFWLCSAPGPLDNGSPGPPPNTITLGTSLAHIYV